MQVALESLGALNSKEVVQQPVSRLSGWHPGF
jgi:hypothetical protein